MNTELRPVRIELPFNGRKNAIVCNLAKEGLFPSQQNARATQMLTSADWRWRMDNKGKVVVGRAKLLSQGKPDSFI